MHKKRRLRAICSYDGSSFMGWQRQAQGVTVQSAIEAVLSKMHKREVKIIGSGRTDRGVNALGQVFHFDTDLMIEVEQYRKAMNAQIDRGIHIIQLDEVSATFHSRIDATYKVYRYTIKVGEPNPFERHRVFFCEYNFDIDRLIKAAHYFVGTHDFTSFNTNTIEEVPNQVKTIHDIQIDAHDNEITITVVGSGFLRYMVRMMVGTLIYISTKKEAPELVKTALEAKDKTLISFMALPQGLTLMKVGYKDEEIIDNNDATCLNEL